MPGIEVSRFKNLTNAEKEELLCGVCLSILVNPMVTPCCQQTYCGDCLTQWLTANETCPNDRRELTVLNLLQAPRVLQNILDKLEIRCEFETSGCSDSLLLANLAQHIHTCIHNPNTVCNKCGEKHGGNRSHCCRDSIIITRLQSYCNELEVRLVGMKKEMSDALEKPNQTIRELNETLTLNNSVISRLSNKVKFNFRLVLENVSRLGDNQSTSSTSKLFCGLSGHVKATRVVHYGLLRNSEFLGFYLVYDNNRCSRTSIDTRVRFSIYSKVENIEEKMTRKIAHNFHFAENECGFNNYMLWSDLCDKRNGYLNDDSITLEVSVQLI